MVSGLVLERDGAQYRVATPAGEIRAVLRGKMKRDPLRVVVGDRVQLEPEEGGELYGITKVEPRRNLLARRVPEGRGLRPVAANVDQAFIVTAAADPTPIPQLIDRLLVVAEANDIAPAVIINKIDLAPADRLAQRLTAAGYRVFQTCAKGGAGIEDLARALAGHVTVVTGPSGAGKSSLLNRIQPGLKLRIGEISAKVRRGTHTTVTAMMVPLGLDGYLVDTPGFSEVGLWDIDPERLAGCFPEMRPFLGSCRFGDCRHRTEPHCSVRKALADGVIGADRYESYLVILSELEGQPKAWE